MLYEAINKLAQSKTTYEAGDFLFKEGNRFEIIKELKTDYDCVLEATFYGSYTYQTSITFKYNEIEHYKCSCQKFNQQEHTCKHLVALAMHFFYNVQDRDKYGEIHPLKPVIRHDSSHSAAHAQIEQYLVHHQMQKSFETVQSWTYQMVTTSIQLIPVIQPLQTKLKFGLMMIIGEQEVIIEDLYQMVCAFENNQSKGYGKIKPFIHALRYLDAKAYQLYQIIKNYLDDIPDEIEDTLGSLRRTTIDDKKLELLKLIQASMPLNLKLASNRTETNITNLNVNLFEVEHNVQGYKLVPCVNTTLYYISKNQVLLLKENVFYEINEGSELLTSLYQIYDEVGMITFYGDKWIQMFETILNPLLLSYHWIQLTKTVPKELKLERMKGYIDFIEQGDEMKINLVIEPLTQPNITTSITHECLLRTLGFEQNEEGWEIKGEAAVLLFRQEVYPKLEALLELEVSSSFIALYEDEQANLFDLRVTSGIRFLEVSIEDMKYSLEELNYILTQMKQKQAVAILDKKVIALNNPQLIELQTFLDNTHLKLNDLETPKKIPQYHSLLIETTQHLVHKKDDGFTSLINAIHHLKQTPVQLPQNINAELRHYQVEGFNWLIGLHRLGFGGVLADEMGLGKTLETIVFLTKLYETATLPSLIIVPSSLVYNWKHELERFSPGLKVCLVVGTPEERVSLIEHQKDNVHIFISTYAQVRNDRSHYEDIMFECIVLDEAQSIKNTTTANAIAVKKLKKHMGLALTGTPIENNLLELYSIFDFIMPGFFKSLSFFKNYYELPINRQEHKRLNQLVNLIKPFLLRRTKKEVLKDLPDKIESIMYTKMSETQHRIYSAYLRQVHTKADALIETNFNQNKIEILALLTRLRQICAHPSLFIPEYKGRSGKLDAIVELIQTSLESNRRILVFSQFTKMLELIKHSLDKQKIKYLYLDGATKSKQRMAYVDAFNAAQADVFLISLKAGGTGLNLTSADLVIHCDPWWNPSVMNQASDRAHRIGQFKRVQVTQVICEHSIEEKIIALQDKKKLLIDQVITEGSQLMTTLSKEELKSLFAFDD